MVVELEATHPLVSEPAAGKAEAAACRGVADYTCLYKYRVVAPPCTDLVRQRCELAHTMT